MKIAIVATTLVLLSISLVRSLAVSDDQRLRCSGDVGPIVCIVEYGPSPGPVEPLGYQSQEEAGKNCSDGDVMPLYRQFVIAGWTCVIDMDVSRETSQKGRHL